MSRNAAPDDEVLEVVQRYLEHHDPRYLAEDVELDIVHDRRPLRGRAAVAARLHDLRHRLFLDIEVDVVHTWVAGGQVLAEATVTGRHLATSRSRPEAGRHFCLRLIAIVTVGGGEIRQACVYHDSAAPLRPLGDGAVGAHAYEAKRGSDAHA